MKSTIFAIAILVGSLTCGRRTCLAAASESPLTYRHFTVEEADDRVISMTPVPGTTLPLWAREVSQTPFDWSRGPDTDKPFFARPIPFVVPPTDDGEPFHRHNHQPSITWLPNGGAHTGRFTATPTRAEHAGYLAATQTPDGMIHLISSRLYYRFNLAWLKH